MGLQSNSLFADAVYLQLLEEKKYEEVFLSCKDYTRQKVNQHLKDFKYYHQFSDDFYHEVCIHIYSRALPSRAFLEALKNGNSFRFYLAKTIRNTLNTLLTREKNKRENVCNFDELIPTNRGEYDIEEKSMTFTDKSYHQQTDSQDLLEQVKDKFDRFLLNFQKVFPKIAGKLILLLKLQARIQIQESDLDVCFGKISQRDKQHILESLGQRTAYLEKDDKEIYSLMQPYFVSYRQEKGQPSALQRWLNQHINGDKYTKGILDKLEIKDTQSTFRIADKKMFADFLYVFFDEKAKKEPTNAGKQVSKETETVFVLKPLTANEWMPSVSHS